MKNKINRTNIPINISPRKMKLFAPGTKLRKRISMEHLKLNQKIKTEDIK